VNKRSFTNIQEVEDFIKTLDSDTKYVFDIDRTGENEFTIQWQEQKYYTAQDGQTFPDEVWYTKEGQLIQIQDLSEAHAKNILRLIIRQRRAVEGLLKSAISQAAAESEEDSLDSLDTQAKDSKITLH